MYRCLRQTEFFNKSVKIRKNTKKRHVEIVVWLYKGRSMHLIEIRFFRTERDTSTALIAFKNITL